MGYIGFRHVDIQQRVLQQQLQHRPMALSDRHHERRADGLLPAPGLVLVHGVNVWYAIQRLQVAQSGQRRCIAQQAGVLEVQ